MKNRNAEKRKRIEYLLRTDEAAGILYGAIQERERQKLGWLLDGDSETGNDELFSEIDRVKESIRNQAYADALQARTITPHAKHRNRATGRGWIKAVAACLVALLIIGGGFTESGRAFAQEAYAAIVGLFNGAFSIRQDMQNIQDKESVLPLNYSNLPETFASIHEAAVFMQRPVVFIESDDASLVDILTMKEDGMYITLQITYSLASGDTLIIWQDFFDPNTASAGYATPADELPDKYTLENGIEIYCGEDSHGDAYAKAVYPYGHVSMSGNGLALDTLKDLLPQIKFE